MRSAPQLTVRRVELEVCLGAPSRTPCTTPSKPDVAHTGRQNYCEAWSLPRREAPASVRRKGLYSERKTRVNDAVGFFLPLSMMEVESRG